MQHSAPVWLVGMMGAGKSSVGRTLARRLGCAFRDTDAEIEREAGRTIAEIFAEEGEAGFRRREHAAVAACAGVAAVVALGGGVMAEPTTAALVSAEGLAVYLRARPATLLERVGDAELRPLLAGLTESERLARIEALLAQREAAYARAELTIDTDERSLEEVVDAVAEALGDGLGVAS